MDETFSRNGSIEKNGPGVEYPILGKRNDKLLIGILK